MGLSQSSGTRTTMTVAEAVSAMTYPGGIRISDSGVFAASALTRYSILSRDDPDRAVVHQLRKDGFPNPRESRAVGCMLGCAIGDTTGAPMEFSPVVYGNTSMKGLDHPECWTNTKGNRFMLKPGQWTDDCSVAMCMADSLLVQDGLGLCDIRMRFFNWWRLGCNNAFGAESSPRGSVGLGGNIGESLKEFHRTGGMCGGQTKSGDANTSGNGSLMRLAPVPVFFASQGVESAMEAAAATSYTTHQGMEAAEACRLLAYVVVRLINRDETAEPDPKTVLLALPEKFESPCYSVTCLAESKQEEAHGSNRGLHLKDRNWNWRDPNHRYSPTRSQEQPGYVGSYAMDALAMALHCAFTTASFEECILKAANMCGDADTVADIAGQIAGAMYGANAIPPSWIDVVRQWDNGGDIALKACKLFHHKRVIVATE